MKANYNLNIIGNNDTKKVLLIHGVGFNYENCFNKMINKLKKNIALYHQNYQGMEAKR